MEQESKVKLKSPQIQVVDYNEKEVKQFEKVSLSDCCAYAQTDSVSWINIDSTREKSFIEEVGKCFDLHPLTIGDMVILDKRPKIEMYEDYMYVAATMLSVQNKEIISEQVSFVVKKNLLLSFQEGFEGDAFTEVRKKLVLGQSKIRRMRTDYLLYSLLLSIINTYFTTLEEIGDRIESTEDELITHPTKKTLNRLYVLKKQMIELRKIVWPLREVISILERNESEFIESVNRPYFRDLYEQTIHLIDTVEMYREILSGMLDIYLSSVSNRLNEVMKVLTVISTVFIPLTFIAGVYGMNFKHMPELQWRLGYPLALTLMLLVAGTFLLYFRRKKWF